MSDLHLECNVSAFDIARRIDLTHGEPWCLDVIGIKWRNVDSSASRYRARAKKAVRGLGKRLKEKARLRLPIRDHQWAHCNMPSPNVSYPRVFPQSV